jgi:Putative addiction module component
LRDFGGKIGLSAPIGYQSMTTAEILDSARKLRADEQLFLIDSLYEMLDVPDLAIQLAWAAEAQDRLVAFERGEVLAAPVEELFAKMRAL